jgi:hypothetical protein
MRLRVIGKICFVVCATLPACVPLLPQTDFVPQMEGGRLLKDYCWGKPSIEYLGRDIVLTSRIMRWLDGRLRLEVRFDIPAGIRVTPLSGAVVIITRNGDRGEVSIEGISRNGNPTLPMSTAGPMVGYTLDIGREHPPGHFWMYVLLEGIDISDFTVALPGLAINGVPTKIPAIRFQETARIQLIAPLQC